MSLYNFTKIVYFSLTEPSKAYDYVIRNNMLREFRVKYEQILSNWKESREKYKMSFDGFAKHYGFSRATYYRKRKILNELNAGRVPISRAPHSPKLRRLSENEASINIANPLKFKKYEKMTMGERVQIDIKPFQFKQMAIRNLWEILRKLVPN